jgi:hypothetical protein
MGNDWGEGKYGLPIDRGYKPPKKGGSSGKGNGHTVGLAVGLFFVLPVVALALVVIGAVA